MKDIFAGGRNNKVPVINGSNEDAVHAVLRNVGACFAHQGVAAQSRSERQSYLMKAGVYPFTVNALIAGGGAAGVGPGADRQGLSAESTRSDASMQASLAATALATTTFSCNGLNVSKRIQQQGSPVWMYEFRDQTAIPLVGFVVGRKYPLSLQQGGARCRDPLRLQPARHAERRAHGLHRRPCRNTGSTSHARVIPMAAGAPMGGFRRGQCAGAGCGFSGGVRPMAASAFAGQHKCDGVWKVPRSEAQGLPIRHNIDYLGP